MLRLTMATDARPPSGTRERIGVAGFTLIEVIVVLGIFAIIGLISSQILSRVLDNERTLSERGGRLAEVQRAMLILQRDILQLSSRGVRDELGDPIDALRIGADGMIEFTRAGWRNPLKRPRSELQRVGYALSDEGLYRAYWLTLDRAPDSEPLRQKLLSDVRQVEFFALDRGGNEHSFWPPVDDPQNDPDTQLAGIVMRIDVEPFGVVERVWPVPSGALPPGAGADGGLTGGADGSIDPNLPQPDAEPPNAEAGG